MRRFTIHAALAILAVVGIASCGGDDSGSLDDIASMATDNSGDGSDDGSTSDTSGGFSAETDEGSMTFGDAAELPDDFPSDVPLPADADLETVITDASNWYLNFAKEDLSTDDCEAWLGAIEDAGFDEDARYESNGDLSGLYSSDDYSLQVGCTPSLPVISLQVTKVDG